MILSIVVGNWRLTWRVSNLCHCVSGEEMIKSPWFAVGSKCLHADTVLHLFPFFCISERGCFCHLFMNTCMCPCVCVRAWLTARVFVSLMFTEGGSWHAANACRALQHSGLHLSTEVSAHVQTAVLLVHIKSPVQTGPRGQLLQTYLLPASVELFIHMLRSDWRLLDVKHDLKGERISRLDAHERQAEDCSCVLKLSLLCSSLNF